MPYADPERRSKYNKARYAAKRDAVKEVQRRYRTRMKEQYARVGRVIAHLARLDGCSKCGKKEGVLDWHHIDPTTKSCAVTDMRHRPWKSILHEMSKCIVLCRSCHTLTHKE